MLASGLFSGIMGWSQMPAGTLSGEERMLEKYGARAYSLITDEDIEAALREL